MLSPYKLYKADKLVARRAVTWGPRGFPAPGDPISKCYNSYNIDWTVHRLAPSIADRGKTEKLRKKAYMKAIAKYNGSDVASTEDIGADPVGKMMEFSPRWGDGRAPRLHTRHVVPLPEKSKTEVSKKTKVAVGATGVAIANNKLDKHFDLGLNYSHPKYKSKIKRKTYTQYKY